MKKLPYLISFIVAIQIFFLITTKFTNWPEMTFWPYLILNGFSPYKDIAIAHTPGLIIILTTWFKLTGLGVMQLKVFTWTVTVTTTFLIYKLVKTQNPRSNPYLPAVVYVMLHLIFEGNGLWFDLFLTPFILITYWLLLKKKFFPAGVLFTIAFFIKQTSFWFLPIIAISLFVDKNRFDAFKKFISGVVLSFFISIVLLLFLGIFRDAIIWAINFGIFTLPRSQGQISPPAARQILFALLPFTVLMFSNDRKLSLWALLGAMGAFPRFELFHFQPALPFIALSLNTLDSKKMNLLKIAYICLISLMFIYSLSINISQSDRFSNKALSSAAAYIDSSTIDGERVFLINEWDSFYIESKTIPATNVWYPYLPWYMSDEVQIKIVNDLNLNKPNYIIMGPFAESGLGSFKPKIILDYVYENFTPTAIIEGRTVFRKI